MAQQQQHIAMIPFPAQGHVNPMMRLACRLAKLGHGSVRVTVFTSEWFVSSATAAREADLTDLIRIRGVEGGAVAESDMKGNHSAVFKMAREAAAMGEAVGQAIRQEPEGISCILSDALLAWSQDLAQEVSVPHAFLWTSSTPLAITFALAEDLWRRGYFPTQEALEKMGNQRIEGLPGLPNFNIADLAFQRFYSDKEGFQLTLQVSRKLRKSACILLNSFEELDGQTLAGLRSLVPNCWPIGPLLPNPLLDQQLTDRPLPSFQFGKLQEDAKCLNWLDKQDPRSVLYISFGSLANLAMPQMEELAMAVEASNVPFLWAIRPSLVEDCAGMVSFFTDFGERTKTRGLLVAWAPQLQVLAHRSTGLFLTHCGWNSTTEAIWNGVSMLTWPCFGDQNTNARFIVSEWRIGAWIDEELLMRPNHFVGRRQIQAAILDAMSNTSIRQRMLAASHSARAAAAPGGSSFRNLENLLNFCRLPSYVPGRGHEGPVDIVESVLA